MGIFSRAALYTFLFFPLDLKLLLGSWMSEFDFDLRWKMVVTLAAAYNSLKFYNHCLYVFYFFYMLIVFNFKLIYFQLDS